MLESVQKRRDIFDYYKFYIFEIMKNLIITSLILLSFSAKGQVGKTLTVIGGTLLAGSTYYYLTGEPDVPLEFNSANFSKYNNDLARYKRNRTAFTVSSTAVLVSGLLLNLAEVKTSKNTALNLQPNGVQFTLRW